jgi:hypothetical protein
MKKPILTEEIAKMRSMMGLNETQMDMFAGTDDEAPAEDSHIGKRVMVYYNLHKKTFSIQYKSLVIAHADYVKLKNVEFRVRQGGKEKVRAEMSKNVHAFVIGDLIDFKPYQSTDIPSPSGSKSITYDPYKYDTFVYKDSEEPVMNAREVEMINQPGGKIFQINEVEQPIYEIALRSAGIQEFIDYINDNPAAMAYLGFNSIHRLIEYIHDGGIRDWDQLRDELEAYKATKSTETDADFDDPINEGGISYDPSKIDEFIVEAKKDIQMAEALIQKFGSALINSPLITIFENLESMKSAQKKMGESQKYVQNKFNKFYDIVEMYEIGEHPDNVRVLDDLSNQLDNHSMTLYQLSDSFEELIDMTEKISRYNEELFKTQTIN